MDIYTIMSNVRLRMDDPRANKPSDMQLLHAVCTQLRIVKTHKRNTSNVWDFNDVIVEVTPGESIYIINQNDFGVPLAVVTWDPDNPIWVARLIPFFKPQNMSFDYSLPNNAASWGVGWTGDNSNCTALRCAFYWRDLVPYIEFQPTPALSASYKIRYLQNSNNINTAALTQELVSNDEADIVEVRAALSLLAVAQWSAADSKDGRAANAERRKDLSDTLMGEERELRRQFEAAQLITTGPRTTVRWSGSDYSG